MSSPRPAGAGPVLPPAASPGRVRRLRHVTSRLALPLLAGAAVLGLPAAPGTAGSASAAVGSPAPVDPPACRYADAATPDAAYADWATTIVDTDLRLPAGYVPPGLVTVGRAGLAGAGRVRDVVIDDLSAMVDAAAGAGAPLAVISAYRSEASQATVFAGWERQVGHAAALLASARPGHSEHQLGTTIDFTTPDGSGPWANGFGRSAQGRWLHAHGWTFGFVESYPADGSPSLTCYQAEPWHYRYVGRELAADVHAAGVPLRVFLFRAGDGAGEAAASSTLVPEPTGPGAASPSITASPGDPLASRGPAGPTAGASSGSPSAGDGRGSAGGARGSIELVAGLAAGLVLGRLGTLFAALRRLGRPPSGDRGPMAGSRHESTLNARRRR